MNDRPSHFALRQWWTQFSNPVTLLILGAVAALLAILGPFETGARLTLAPRFAYWLVTSAATYSVGMLTNSWLLGTLPPVLPIPLRVAVAGLITGLAITPVVLAINYVTFDFFPSGREWPGLLLQFLAIAMIISIIFHAVATARPDENAETPAAQAVASPRLSPLLDRLPLDKRGDLVALSSEDHYTRIRTTRGEELVLIRLSDAIREAEPVPGLKVHRSHWVALGQVTAATRDGDKAILTVTGGDDIPVSRANVKAIKDAGLLPQ